MFTGIVEEIGAIERFARCGEGFRVSITACDVLDGTKVGDSISVNGVCLTVASLTSHSFQADIMPETVAHSSFAHASVGQRVNLERALQLSARLAGHIVTGHIDGVARVVSITKESDAHRIQCSAESSLTHYMVKKGSIALQGVSLTLTDVSDNGFGVSVIPHTFTHTTFAEMRAGDSVNVECDILGKYVFRFLKTGKDSVNSFRSSEVTPSRLSTDSISFAMLAENGF